jgi:hypothetical protein
MSHIETFKVVYNNFIFQWSLNILNHCPLDSLVKVIRKIGLSSKKKARMGIHTIIPITSDQTGLK